VEHSADGPDLVNRAQRVASGTKYYNGSPCGRCGGLLRYAVTRACVVCTRRKARAVTAVKKEAQRSERMAACRRLGII
jgi:hypothetical protein